MIRSTRPSFIQIIFSLLYGLFTTCGMYQWQQAVGIHIVSNTEWWMYLIIPSIVLCLLLVSVCYEMNVRYAFGIDIDERFGFANMS